MKNNNITDCINQNYTRTIITMNELFNLEKAVLLYDCSKESLIYQENMHMQLPVYSITKILTAMVTIEEVPDLENAELTIMPECIQGIEYQVNSFAGFELHINERYTVLDLLYGCIVSSGCEAALQLAYYVGQGSITDFMALVHKKLIQLGCLDTRFIDPTGCSDENRSTAADICTILQYAMRNPLFRKITSTSFCRFAGFPEANWSTNKLINPRYWQESFFPYAIGGKTGSTVVDGVNRKNLACMFERAGREYIGIILNDYSPQNESSDIFTKIEPIYPHMISLLEKEFAKQPYMRIQLSQHYISASAGTAFSLLPELTFTNYDDLPIFRWFSTDETIATVNASGFVKVLRPGITQIIVKTQTEDYDFCQLNSTGRDELTISRPNINLYP